MKKLALTTLLGLILAILVPRSAFAAGIYTSGGGNYRVGDTISVSVAASGAGFDSFQGVISVSGNLSVVSIAKGGATFLPGKEPSNGGQFVGITSERNSLTIATVKVKATGVGSGTVSVSNVKLANKGSVVGTEGGSTSIKIDRALNVAAAPKVSSSTHPDPGMAYDATTVNLAWNKESGVDGFSYVFDDKETTAPAAKIGSTETSVSYPNQAIGTYYFHLRAHNADGWSGTTHFKINIKEPDAKIDETLGKPNNITVEKSNEFKNDITAGLFSGLIIKGKNEPKYKANVTLEPLPTVPEGKSLSVETDENGSFELLLDYPLKSGFYKLTVQGQKDKVLTPVSDPIYFEISQKKGGVISLLTADDEFEPPVIPPPVIPWYEKLDKRIWIGANALLLLLIAGGAFLFIRRIRAKSLK